MDLFDRNILAGAQIAMNDIGSMKQLRHPARHAIFALISMFFASAVWAAENSGQSQPAGTVTVSVSKTLKEVQDAIVMVASARQWVITEKSDGRVVAYLKHRSNEATLTLTYDTAKIDLSCIGWKIDKKTGVREKPELPSGWIKNIRGDLEKILTRPAPGK